MSRVHSRRFNNIILIGMPAVGKSTFGQTYAHFSKRTFIDFDRYLENIAGKSIPKIFAEQGEDAFRTLEERCLKKLERRQNCTIAMGGGTLCSHQNIAVAKSLGLIVM